MYIEKNISFKNIDKDNKFIYKGEYFYIIDKKLTVNYLVSKLYI